MFRVFRFTVMRTAEKHHLLQRFSTTHSSVAAGTDSDLFGDYVGPSEKKPPSTSRKSDVSRKVHHKKFKNSTDSNAGIQKRRPERQEKTSNDFGDVFGTLASSKEVDKSHTIFDYKNNMEYAFEEEGGGGGGREDDVNRKEPEKEDETDPWAERPEIKPFVVAKHTPRYFQMMQRNLANEGKVAEMMAVMEKRMLEDRVRPEKINFTEALAWLGRYGQPRKAIELYNKMCRMELRSTAKQRSSLFNACANCASVEKEWALNQTKLLLTDFRGKFGPLALPEYHAAMKAYARHGDVPSAFRIADLMVLDRVKPTVVTFIHLLQACVSDRSSGFKLALDVWRAMQAFGIPANEVFYNTLLRACRDCGLGESGDRAIEQMVDEQLQLLRPTSSCPTSTPSSPISTSSVFSSSSPPPSSAPTQDSSPETADEAPFIQEHHHHRSVPFVPSLQELDEKLDKLEREPEKKIHSKGISQYERQQKIVHLRLALLRGGSGILEQMDKDGAIPDVKTFALLLDLVPASDVEEEKALLKSMIERRVKPDVDFMNALISRHCRRRQFEDALELLNECKKYDLQLNHRTFSSLAIGCQSQKMGVSLLRDMEAYGLNPNSYVLNPLLRHALQRGRRYDFFYAMSVMSWYKKANVEVPKDDLRYLEQRRREAEEIEEKRRVISARHRDGNFKDDLPPVWGFKEFLPYYKDWLRKVQLKDSTDPKLKLLDKEVTADDVREDWEKPWAQQAKEQKRMDEYEKAKLIPVE